MTLASQSHCLSLKKSFRLVTTPHSHRWTVGKWHRLIMYAMAFFAALRVGEITCKPTQPRGSVIFLNQTVFMKNRDGVVSSIKATLKNYKHSDPDVPVDIFLYREKLLCPVSTVLAYLGLRGTSAGPLFVGQMLRQFLVLFSLRHYQTHFDIASLNVEGYKSHSFSIGAASWAAAKGMSDAQIKSFR